MPDSSQQQVLAGAKHGGSAVVFGAAGTGKSRTAVELLRSSTNAYLLSPSRARTEDLATIAASVMTGPAQMRPVRTPVSFAFSLVPQTQLLTGDAEVALVTKLIAACDWDPFVPPETLVIPAFITEVRGFVAQCVELGLDVQSLLALRTEDGWQPIWVVLAQVLEKYQQWCRERSCYDANSLVNLAAKQIRAGHAQLPPTLVVDDFQDMNRAVGRLLRAVLQAGTQLVVFANPDVTVEGYRGAVATLARDFAQDNGLEVLTLANSYRQSGQLAKVAQKFVQNIGVGGPVKMRNVVPGDVTADRVGGAAKADKAAEIKICDSETGQMSLVAKWLFEHNSQGVAWDDMAVIVRSVDLVWQWRTGLQSHDIPLAPAARPVALGTEVVSRCLCEMALLGAGAADLLVSEDASPARLLAAQWVEGILRSPYFGLDAISLLTFERHLRDPFPQFRDNLLFYALRPEVAQSLVAQLADTPAAASAQALAQLAALVAQVSPADGPALTIWKLWDGLGLAEKWAENALSDPAYDDYLDTLLVLFRAADVWQQREGGANAFFENILAQTIPTDTLAVMGQRPPGVHVLTPAQAAGKQFTAVALGSVSTEIWPNTRVRDAFLKTGKLADMVMGQPPSKSSPRKAVVTDEARQFLCALTRAKTDLLVTSADSAEAAPSLFISHLRTGDITQHCEDGKPVVETANFPVGMRGFVGDLRARALAGEQAAVDALAVLHAKRIPLANPRRWAGGDISCTVPLVAPEKKVYVSPSGLENALDCPLNWFLTKHGGQGGSDWARSIGTLVHAIAEEYPEGKAAELQDVLAQKLSQIEIPDTEWGRRDRERAQRMVQNLADYIAAAGKAVGVEEKYGANVGRARLTCRIDRIEADTNSAGEKTFRIVDFKTGKTPKTKDQVREDKQLWCYQVALAAQGVVLGGAQLVYLGAKTETALVITAQEPIAEDSPAYAAIETGAEIMAAAQFFALENTRCRSCPVHTCCPLKEEGKRLV